MRGVFVGECDEGCVWLCVRVVCEGCVCVMRGACVVVCEGCVWRMCVMRGVCVVVCEGCVWRVSVSGMYEVYV